MGVVYPHITIKDTEEASLLQLDATDNTVLVPVPYVRRYYLDPEDNMVWDPEEEMYQIQAKLYDNASQFLADWSNGGGEWEVSIDPVTEEVTWIKPKEPTEIDWEKADHQEWTGSIPRYICEYAVKLTGDKDNGTLPIYDVVFTPEKSYLMVVELLKRGLPVLVRPIPHKIDGDSNIVLDKPFEGKHSKPGQLVADDPSGKYTIGTGNVNFNRHSGIAVASHAFLTRFVNDNIKVDDTTGKSILDNLADRNIYPIKFITSGAYPNIANVADSVEPLNAYINMTKLAAERGDAIAIIEHREDILSKEDLLGGKFFDDADLPNLSSEFERYKLAAAFTPWCEFNIEKRLPSGRAAKFFNLSNLTTMPAGFAYLMAYAYSIQTNETWWAAAGVLRGQIPQMVRPLFEIGDSLMHLLQGKDANKDENKRFQKVRLNPIMNTGSYGYRIWGNRVAGAFSDLAGAFKTMYSEFLNVRMLLCDIKKQIYAAAMRTTFEPNDDITWISFKVLCSNLLDRMKSGRGLLWYKWTKEVSEERATIKAKLTIRPIEAVEHFDITVFLSDQDAEVEE